jgi:hypothetical protein
MLHALFQPIVKKTGLNTRGRPFLCCSVFKFLSGEKGTDKQKEDKGD